MAVSRFNRRLLVGLGLGVAIPALVLAGLAVYLTLRIVRAVEDDTVRYNTYLAQQVAQAFEQELMAHLRRAASPAENAARSGDSIQEVIDALRASGEEFEGAHFVPLDELDGYSLLIVESQPLIYAPGQGADEHHYFAGILLRGEDGQVVGAGGWWLEPRSFLTAHLDAVVQERLPSNPRMYGGLESTRKLSVQLLDPAGQEIGRVRDPVSAHTAHTEALAGPFESYSARVAATSNAPVVWTRRFVALEVAFIALMGLAIVLAVAFGLRYTLRQLELAQLKAGFVSNVTHELKTPIALIRLAVETLEMRRVSSPEEQEKFIHTIGRETLRLSQLVDNILDFARLEAGQRIFRLEPVDLGQITRDALETFAPRLEHLGFRVQAEVPDPLPAVNGDPTALTHCLLNLLDNAVKYSRELRELRVVAGTRDDQVYVSVTDRGIGIAPEDQGRIFEKFVRLETGLVHDVKGAGLGLSLVEQIIRAHGGRVEVQSAAGQGSTFTLLLPVAGAMSIEKAEPRQRTAS